MNDNEINNNEQEKAEEVIADSAEEIKEDYVQDSSITETDEGEQKGETAVADTNESQPSETTTQERPVDVKENKETKLNDVSNATGVTTKSGKAGVLFAIGIIALVLGLIAIGLAIYIAFTNGTKSFSTPEVFTPDHNYVQTASQDGLTLLDNAGVAKLCLPGTVLIKTNSGMGSGFIYTTDGIIVTNCHVISDSTKITVELYDGRVFDAEVLGMDRSSDVGVIKINATGLTNLEIGDSKKTVVGDSIVVIGNPYSETLSFSVSFGCISAIRDEYHFESLATVLNVFQHDAALNSGNSGGPLINMYGQVIGINSIKMDGYEGLNFAIRIDSVLDIITDIINYGAVQKPIIGITCQTDYTIGGVIVREVSEGSPAQKAGILVNDIITKIDGVRVTTTEELITIIRKHEIGDKCTITLLRDVESLTVDIILGEPKS